MAVTKLALLFTIGFCFSVWGAENCSLLRSYVTFQHSSGMPVTRIVSSGVTDQRLRELLEFAKDNNIVVTKGPAPLSTGKTSFISVSGDALASESALADQLERSLVDYFETPLNFEKLPLQSQRLVQKMKENFGTKFIREQDAHGMSYENRNMIGIKTRHPDNLRVSGVVNHEITHNTTDRKIYEAFNPKPGKLAQPLTESLAGRAMNFRPKPGKRMSLPQAIDGYDRYMCSDEVEANLREMAQARKDGLTVETQLKTMNAFMDSQEMKIRSLLKNHGNDFEISHGDAVDELKAGRRQQRIVTTKEADYFIEVLVPKGLSPAEERAFVKSVLEKRIETFESYRKNSLKKFSDSPQSF